MVSDFPFFFYIFVAEFDKMFAAKLNITHKYFKFALEGFKLWASSECLKQWINNIVSN